MLREVQRKMEIGNAAKASEEANPGRSARSRYAAQPAMPTRTESIDPLHEFCRSLPGVAEDTKWGHDHVFSVGGKMFASFSVPEGEPFGFKADPLVFEDLTKRAGIEPAHYLAKHQWVSVQSRDNLPLEETKALLREAHGIVAGKLSKKLRKSFGIE